MIFPGTKVVDPMFMQVSIQDYGDHLKSERKVHFQ